MIISRPFALLQTCAGRALSRFLSLQRRFHPPPSSPKAKYAGHDREGPKAFDHTCFVPSKAKPWSVTSASSVPVASTNLKRDRGNTEDSLRNWIQLSGVNFLSLHVEFGQTTSANTAPYLIALSTAFSVDSLIIGEYSSSNPSSCWSDERRASAYAHIIR